MQLAFYLASSGNLLDKAINFFSGRHGLSHAELVFSDGVWASSSPRDKGVRFKRINPKPGHWVFVDVPSTDDQEAIARGVIQSKVGTGYDFLGVLRFVFRWMRPSKSRWFCSEIIVHALQVAGELDPEIEAHLVSPNDLHKLVSDYGYSQSYAGPSGVDSFSV